MKKQIMDILFKHFLSMFGAHTTSEEARKAFNGATDEIAQLMQPSNELLEAAKDALNTFYGVGCTDEAEIVQELKNAIANYEKQIK